MYALNSFMIAAVLLFSMLAVMELGYRLGRRRRDSATELTRRHVNGVQASLLGVLALLLGFSFSLALQRFDSRSEAVVDEANAIGTAWLRAKLLPESVRSETLELFRQYIDLRARAGHISVAHESERDLVLAQTDRVLAALWRCAERAVQEDKSPVPSGIFVQALNAAIDAHARNEAILARHVPGLIMGSLFGTLVLTAGAVGFATGFAGHRPSFVTYVLVVSFVMLAFTITDLDRPRRGFILVDQSSFTNLRATIEAEANAAPQP
jgi:hypothetical protein